MYADTVVMLKVSIVVPTYNEEYDIRETLESLVNLDWPDYEILVVDDSTDRTPEIVSSFNDRGVRLIQPKERDGRCAARNLGIMEADGDIVVILNADVHLPVDFLSLIARHYEREADYVLVRSEVENLGDLFARFIESVSRADFYNKDPQSMQWTEGFSCRRDLAIKAGLFPTGFVVPMCAGEDWFFGENLRNIGAHKHVDLDIVCTHIAPATITDYWLTRKGRGRGSPQVRRFLEGWSYGRIMVRAALRVMRTVVMSVTLLPMALVCYRYAKESPRRKKDLLPFCWAWLLQEIAFSVGEWQSLLQLMGYTEKNPNPFNAAKR